MTAYTLQSIAHPGAAITLTAPAVSGNTAPCGAGLGLVVKNADASSHTVTISVPAAFSFDGLPIAGTGSNGGRALAVAAGATSVVPLVPSVYQDPTTGLATFGFDAVTSVTCGVIAISA